jgi:hypothetical protein
MGAKTGMQTSRKSQESTMKSLALRKSIRYNPIPNAGRQKLFRNARIRETSEESPR